MLLQKNVASCELSVTIVCMNKKNMQKKSIQYQNFKIHTHSFILIHFERSEICLSRTLNERNPIQTEF